MISASILGSLLIIVAFLFGRESIYFEKANNDKKQNISFNFNSLNKDNATDAVNTENIITNNSQTKIVNNQSNVDGQNNTNNKSVGRIYASSKGKKYYIEGICDGNISPKNKVYYKDESVAIKSGKAKAAGCI